MKVLLRNNNIVVEAAELKLYEETQQYEDAMFAAAIQEYLGDAQVNIDAMEEGKTKTQTSTIVTCPLCHTHKLLQTKHAILCKCGLKIRTNVFCFFVVLTMV